MPCEVMHCDSGRAHRCRAPKQASGHLPSTPTRAPLFPPEAFWPIHQRHSGFSTKGIQAHPPEAFRRFHQRHSGVSTRGIQACPPEAFRRVHQRHSGPSTRGIQACPPEAHFCGCASLSHPPRQSHHSIGTTQLLCKLSSR